MCFQRTPTGITTLNRSFRGLQNVSTGPISGRRGATTTSMIGRRGGMITSTRGAGRGAIMMACAGACSTMTAAGGGGAIMTAVAPPIWTPKSQRGWSRRHVCKVNATLGWPPPFMPAKCSKWIFCTRTSPRMQSAVTWWGSSRWWKWARCWPFAWIWKQRRFCFSPAHEDSLMATNTAPILSRAESFRRLSTWNVLSLFSFFTPWQMVFTPTVMYIKTESFEIMQNV